ncbi:MAG: glycoside hydrolase family 2 TIM barrel-domain containing protein [Chitinophagaceae bacterium]
MKKLLLIFLLSFVARLSFAQSYSNSIPDFNRGWKFFLGNDTNAIHRDFNDSKWRKLDLPHDWSIEGDFSETNPATTQGGALPGGIGWYRKMFVMPSIAYDKNVFIEFDGVYRNSEVWINGQWLGKRPNGYVSFQYDITRYLKWSSFANFIVVKVDNSQQPNSRWYTGSGIYRNVRLTFINKISVDRQHLFITTPVVDTKKATINIKGLINSAYNTSIKIQAEIYDGTGVMIKLIQMLKTVKINSSGIPLDFTLDIDRPKLWSVTTPDLYKVVVKVIEDKKVIDIYSHFFGIRFFRFDEQKGFFLNNKPMKILGVCMHHDLGALGAAVNTRAIERQLKILKAMGCNAIRTSHNPPTPELLDLCDKMGFLVIDEAFDMWHKKKNKYDYAADFDEWHRTDLEDMVKRDRNHPSVFMWSIGNEIREQFDSTGISITKELVNIIKSLDSSRPVTAALSEWKPEKNYMYRSGALDVVGLNYHHDVYADFPKYYPGQKMIGTENMSALATRGSYDFPSDTIKRWPQKSPQKFVENGNSDYTVSAYDQVSAYWGSTHEETWKIIKKYDYLSGLFVWTGFDYLGEPTPYPWPARSSYFGIIDLAGFPKDVYYMYQSEWTSKPVLHLFPHWSWKVGQTVDVWAYYNNADEVELFLNNKSLGVRKKNNDELHVMWRVPFEPGELKAVSRKNGQTVLVKRINTAGAPAKIELIADRKVLKADGNDLSFITVRILDKDGNLVPDADNLVHFSLTGEGKIEATDNGYEADLQSFKLPQRKCWKGMALVIVRTGQKKGNVTLQAGSEGLPNSVLSLENR